MRKLATIQKIERLSIIDKADNIMTAQILGWECVVKKNEFKEGDLCVYIEIDSILPTWKQFQFMEPRKYRVKTAKFKKQISQGLALPIDIFNNIKGFTTNIGDDVTEILMIKKYDPEAKIEEKENQSKNKLYKYMLRFKWFRNIIKNDRFPPFLKKTDETRIQTTPGKFKCKNFYYVTEKLDGQSATYAIRKNKYLKLFTRKKIYVCSRNIHLLKHNNSNYWNIYDNYNIKKILMWANKYYGNIAIQGEIVGPGIQKNTYKLDNLKFYMFTLFFIDKQQYANYNELIKFIKLVKNNGFNLEMVPILHEQYILPNTINDVVEFSKGKSILNNNVIREGIVGRNLHDSNESWKCINPIFLLNDKSEFYGEY